ncbi:MAG TPA: serine/threonine-protein kinase [Pyrinomonadaceae bacterium]|nr:serine/threonine-protein kinase [Pyrinomonadaceae bacterium]
MKECPKCELCYPDDVGACPHDQTSTRLSLPGDQLLAGRYFLERRLGRGAMGQVYLARDKKFETRRVAVKTVRQDVLNSDNLQEGEAIARFEREAQAAASIQHPNTVSVTDFGESEEGVFYLVMEYVEGETLHRLLRREGTLPVKRAVNILRQIADGVEAAHEIGILHRDLKPANIFLLQRGKGDGFVKVGDFGLAKIVNQTASDLSSNATPSSRGIIGTPEFMAPEQMQPEVGVDTRADIYALGTIAYLMLGGKTPFAGDMMQLVMQKIMHKPPSLSTLRSDVPLDVERVIMRSLEIEARDRQPSVAEWIDELEIASEDVEDKKGLGGPRLVVLAPVNAEVYVDDERKASIGRSGRIVLTGIPAGQHILRVCRAGEKDDERVIEVRAGAEEQVIQAQLRSIREHGSHPSPSQGSSSSGAHSSLMPGIVACSNCGSRFAEGVKFCGRCGSRSFALISAGEASDGFPCPRCSNTLPAKSKFCGRCGLALATNPSTASRQSFGSVSNMHANVPKQAERVCGRCGSSYPPNIRFCGRCGGNLY